MADALTTITKLINSPPGQLAAGGVLAGIVWRFFKHVGDALNEKTNWEIAHWLRVRRLEIGIAVVEAVDWPTTFGNVFDGVFGTKHLSWKCFLRSCVASYCAVAFWFAVGAVRYRYFGSWRNAVLLVLVCGGIGNLIPDYISLLETRWVLRKMSKTKGRFGLLLADATITMVIGITGGVVADMSYSAIMRWRYPGTCGGVGLYNCFVDDLSHYFLVLRVALESRVQVVDDYSGPRISDQAIS
jgi:hypothetical protein